jgi:putative glycosyltransferase (TIGR04348 family)
MHRPTICIVTPAMADANNGNWQTAKRWARMLSTQCHVRLSSAWPDGQDADLLIALHARRSAASVAAWARVHPTRPVVVVLTGTDVYRDIHTDAAAQATLHLAHRLVVLQDQALVELPEHLRGKAQVIYQSCSERKTLRKTRAHLRVLMVGHLRDEKWPHVLWQAAQQMSGAEGIHIDHIGKCLEPALGQLALATAQQCPHYRWLGERTHAATRAHIQRAHLLVHTSRLEGGAHVLMEAVRCGTPVLASKISGNVGMLGPDYDGYFTPGSADELAQLLRTCRQQLEQVNGLCEQLQVQCASRAPLFSPAAEAHNLQSLLAACLQSP